MSNANTSKETGCGCLVLVILAGLLGYGVFALIHYVISPGCPHSSAHSHSTTTSSSPSCTPTATQEVHLEVHLIDAVKHGLVDVQSTGNGLQSMQLSLSSKSHDYLHVTVDTGTIFGANSSNVQTMVAIKATDVLLNPGDREVQLTVDVACTNMTLDAPTQTDTFDVRASRSHDLLALVNLPNFQLAPFRIQQFAIWTITDNPATPNDFTQLGTPDSGFSGPTEDEINQIRQLFTEARINTSNYTALQ